MKLGLLTSILPSLNFRQVVDFCAQIGITSLEVACWPKQKAERRYSGVTHLDINNLSDEEIEDELNYAKTKNVCVHALGFYPNPLSADENTNEDAINHIYKLIDVAKKNNIGVLSTFVGKNNLKTVEENLKLFESTWKPIVDYAQKNKIKIAIENCPMLFTQDEWPGGKNLASTPEIWDKMFKIIDSDFFGLNYDPSHFVLQNMDYIAPIYKYKHKIFHIHLKDITIVKEKLNKFGSFSYPSKYSQPKLPGFGDINWGKFCNALYDINYTASACLEIEDRNFEESIDMVKKGIEIGYKNVQQYF